MSSLVEQIREWRQSLRRNEDCATEAAFRDLIDKDVKLKDPRSSLREPGVFFRPHLIRDSHLLILYKGLYIGLLQEINR